MWRQKMLQRDRSRKLLPNVAICGMEKATINTLFTREQLDLYFASYIGMEGGNPAGEVWFYDGVPPSTADPLVGAPGAQSRTQCLGCTTRLS
ncbi:protein of unknown function (plasmid) [Cupriavidus taiwanensis]|nr:protein of unknown function [Cupriavidus taiwanensis]SPA11254.1 protein of unknown function [Cupriavidus taiwanensis]SPA57218.1 protein of unknown function [Cupriavidus taiwanensis]SPD48836.1 protein of unknown function [Cupriavidus taiwanensis]